MHENGSAWGVGHGNRNGIEDPLAHAWGLSHDASCVRGTGLGDGLLPIRSHLDTNLPPLSCLGLGGGPSLGASSRTPLSTFASKAFSTSSPASAAAAAVVEEPLKKSFFGRIATVSAGREEGVRWLLCSLLSLAGL